MKIRVDCMKSVFLILLMYSFLVMCSTTPETKMQESKNFECNLFYDSLSGLFVYNKYTYEPTLNIDSGSFLDQFRKVIELHGCEIDKPTIKVGYIIDEEGKLKFPRLIGENKNEQRKYEICLVEAIDNINGWYPGKCKDSIVSCYVERIIQIHY